MNDSELKVIIFRMIDKLRGDKLLEIAHLLHDELSDDDGEITWYSVLAQKDKERIRNAYEEMALDDVREKEAMLWMSGTNFQADGFQS